MSTPGRRRRPSPPPRNEWGERPGLLATVDVRNPAADLHYYALSSINEAGAAVLSGAGRNTVEWGQWVELRVTVSGTFAAGDFVVIAWAEDWREGPTAMDAAAERAIDNAKAARGSSRTGSIATNTKIIRAVDVEHVITPGAGRTITGFACKSLDASGGGVTWAVDVYARTAVPEARMFAPAFACLTPIDGGGFDLAARTSAATHTFARPSSAYVWDGGADQLKLVAEDVPAWHGCAVSDDGVARWKDARGVPLHPVRTLEAKLIEGDIDGRGGGLLVFDAYPVVDRNTAYALGDRVLADGLRPYNDGAGGAAYDQGSYYLECVDPGTTHASQKINEQWALTSVELGGSSITDGRVRWKIGGRYARHGVPGVRIEASGSNLLVSPRDFDTTWTAASEATVSTAVGLDGTPQKIRLSDQSAAAQQLQEQVVSVSGSTAYTFSAFVQKEERDPSRPSFASIGLVFDGTGTPTERPNFDVRTGAIGVNAAQDDGARYVEDWGAWWRVIITCTSAADSTTATVSCFPGRNLAIGGTGSALGEGDVTFDFAQFEEGSYATSPLNLISRAADSLHYDDWAANVQRERTTIRLTHTGLARAVHAASNPLLTNDTGTGAVKPLYIEGRDQGTRSKMFIFDDGAASNQTLQDILGDGTDDFHGGHLLGVHHDLAGGTTAMLNGQHHAIHVVAHHTDNDRDTDEGGDGSGPTGRISSVSGPRGLPMQGDAAQNGMNNLWGRGLPNSPLWLGNNSALSRAINGVLSNVIIFDDALPDSGAIVEQMNVLGEYDA